MAMANPTQANGHTNGSSNGAGYEDFKSMNFLGEVTKPKAAPSNNGNSDQYSAFVHRQGELLGTLYGVIMWGNTDPGKPQLLLQRLFRSFEREWTAVCTNRDGYITLYNNMAKDWTKYFNQEPLPIDPESGDPLPSADELLTEWNTQANTLAEAYVQKKKHGLYYVREALLQVEERDVERDGKTVTERRTVATARTRLDAARHRMEEVRFEAAKLPPARQQYFWCKLQAYRLAIDRNVDIALGIPVVDYTKVKNELIEGRSIHLAIWDMPWAYRELYGRVFGSMADGDTMRDFLTTNQIQQWPYDRRPPKQNGKGLLGLLKRGDDDEDDEDDDRSPAQRRRDEKKERDKDKKGRKRGK